MPKLIRAPAVIPAAGTPPKQINEFVGCVKTGQSDVSVAYMKSPAGWSEPGQRPQFQEINVMLKGTLRVEFEGGSFDVGPGEAVIAKPGEWVRYSTPGPDVAEYVSICVPAFSPENVHRDA